MTLRTRFALLLVASMAPIAPAAQTPTSGAGPSGDWRGRIAAIREAFPGDMAVFAKHLGTGETLAIDADTAYETFSVIKVPIMAEVLRQAEEGRFRLTDRVTYDAEDARLPSGVLYVADPGLQPTVKDLLYLMIMISDNSATDMLADKVGRDSVTAFMRRLGLERTEIRYSDLDWDRRWLGFLDPSYRDASGDRTIGFPFEKYPDEKVSDAFRRVIYETEIFFGRSTAREMGRVFELMARGELVSRPASELMISILKRQQVRNRIPRYLENVTAAHKTGDGQPWIGNDAGILWIEGQPQPIVLVVFTGRHRGTTASLHDAVARVAAIVVDHFGGKVDPAALAGR
jgi:beta-lactamase class A